MEEFSKEVNSFSRNLYNLEKKGAYYTPTEICKRIAYLFKFPKGEFNAIDPTCGDGEALLACVAGTQAHPMGCELDEVVAAETDKKFREKKGLVKKADFFRELKCTYNVFDFCFSNPPYIKDEEDGKRLETKCIDKMYGLLRKNAYIAVVVPYGIVQDANKSVFLKTWAEKYETVGFYRFDEKDYEQFHQIVLIGQKRPQILKTPLNSLEEDNTPEKEVERVYGLLNELSKLPYLPKSPEEVDDSKKYPIKESSFSDIKFFTTVEFNNAEARKELGKSNLLTKLGEMFSGEPFGVLKIGNPPIPLGKDHMYLAAVAGAGQGFCGNEEEGTLHLQRGITKRVEQEDIKADGTSKKVQIAVTSYIKTGLNIIQADGTISELS